MSEDQRFLEAFHDGSLPPEAFGHRQHLRLAWLELERRPLHEALFAVADGTRRFAERHGAAGKYHTTVTWSLVLLMHQRRESCPAGTTFDRFLELHPELVEDARGLLDRLYRRSTLDSALARRTFVLPDLTELPRG